ncbi:MAG: glycosyl hydrolase [Bacteroidia bacterium]|nr:glycosyl hydrolase [Bacteroidia bacterium]
MRIIAVMLFMTCGIIGLRGQNAYELNHDWKCIQISKVKLSGEKLSDPSSRLSGWLPATVPGTVLTTLLNNKLVPDPFWGMNNTKIPDIYFTGRDYYTYWFIKDFNEKVTSADELIWLHFRGVNYGCNIYLNSHKLNPETHFGMFLRQTYNITPFLAKDGINRLAVIVYPPDPVGNPNGGQGGDGTIGRNVSHQYTAGWDWIQPVRDRNTGIWDKVIVEKTNFINLKNPHIVTLVPGKRFPGEAQQPVIIKATAEIENPSKTVIAGTLQYKLDGNVIKKEVSLQPNSTTEVQLPDLSLSNPKLWWPNGYGEQFLYPVEFEFLSNTKQVLDRESLQIGVREIQTVWNERTRSREVMVNGQKIFIRGGNWIVSDAMLRLTDARYEAEIRFHRDMNLNLIRIWGGALTERPEFFKACDKYGLLVFQDFWISGDCNGRWVDPMKKEDQWMRRKYPDNHRLFIESVVDQVKMIRNHASLAFYCGGNEIVPPVDIYNAMKDSIMPRLDGTRYFFSYSNTDSMSYNSIGGNGDGPYTIQPVSSFWETHTFPFNSEVGNVGTGDIESLERFIPEENMVVPDYTAGKIDSVWKYHKDIGYGSFIDAYGKPGNVKDFAFKAQLVNYDQYRALIEGFSSHAWDWYTGVIIWKTQNPWTALRGQMYDYYFDPNGCLYGLHNAGEQLHAMCNPVDGMLMIVNNSFHAWHDVMLQVIAIDLNGKDSLLTQQFCEISPTSVQKYFSMKRVTDKLREKQGVFLTVRLTDASKHILSDNLYWLPDSSGNYSGLQTMQQALIKTEIRKISEEKIEVNISNPANGALAFFNRISLVDEKTRKRILPVFYSDNYISVLPGERKTITIEYSQSIVKENAGISVSGWNVKECYLPIR